MFNFFKKNQKVDVVEEATFNIELIAYALAYEVAIADGDIDGDELNRIKSGLLRISDKLSQSSDELLEIIVNDVCKFERTQDINDKKLGYMYFIVGIGSVSRDCSETHQWLAYI